MLIASIEARRVAEYVRLCLKDPSDPTKEYVITSDGPAKPLTVQVYLSFALCKGRFTRHDCRVRLVVYDYFSAV